MLRSLKVSSRGLPKHVQQPFSAGLVASRQYSQRTLRPQNPTQPSSFLSSSRPHLLSHSSSALISTRSLSWTPWRSETPPHPSELPSIPRALEQPAKTDPVVSSSSSEPIAASSSSSESIASTSALPTSPSDSVPTPLSEVDQLLPQPPADLAAPTIRSLLEHHAGDAQAVLNSPEAVHAAMQTGDLHLMGLTHSILNPAGWIRDVMELVHVDYGLPWWGTIMAVTAMLRLCVFPMVIRVQGNNTRLAAIQPQSQALMAKIKEAKEAGNVPAQQIYGKEMMMLWKDNDCSPWKSMALPLVQMPLFMSFFFAIRKMAILPVPQLKEGGVGWVMDLTSPDPFYILPVSSMLLTLGVLQVGADGTGAKTRQMQHFVNFFKVASPGMIYFFGQMPAALLFYWTFNNGLTLLQAILLKQAPVRALLRLESPPEQPPLAAGTKVEPPPTIKDTFNTIKEFFAERHKVALDEAEKRAAARLKAGPGRAARLAGPDMQQKEVIREAGVDVGTVTQESYKAGVESGFLEDKTGRQGKQAPKAAAVQGGDEKARRVAAARERRERNSR